ncbi:butyrophilin subfamily 2 member A1-like isoform X2 [Hoplias malabaricus]|uniref:butyrophilin subfamily 2 member A1-like isoform X2 n=1 Tax=Hoplias malabaricus TaxID=27720 RepID=UPI003462C9AE
MVRAILLTGIWLFLSLTVCHAQNTGVFFVVVTKAPVSGQLGASVSLPCTVHNYENMENMDVRWYRPKSYSKPVIFYNKGKIEANQTDEQYTGRVSLSGDLDKGDVSLKLDNLILEDKGEYICHVSSESWYDKGNVSLKIQVLGSTPILSVVNAGGGQVNVSCHSHGWHPAPVLIWRDAGGKDLKQINNDKFTNTSEGLVNVSSWLLISPSDTEWLSCSVGVTASNENRRESRVVPQSPTELWKEAFITTLLFLLLCIIGVGVYCVLHQKGLIGFKRKSPDYKSDKYEDSSELTQPLMQQNKPPAEDTPLQSVFTDVVDHGSAGVDQQERSPQTVQQPQTSTVGPGVQEQSEKQNSPEVKNTPLQDVADHGSAGVDQQERSPQTVQQPQTSTDVVDHGSAGVDQQERSPQTVQQPQTSTGPGVQEQSEKQNSPEVKNTPLQDVADHGSAGVDQQERSPQTVQQPQTSTEWDEMKMFKVKITIDPEETPQFFRVSHEGKGVFCLKPRENHEDEKLKIFSLCKETFSSGKHYWKVKVCQKPKEKLSWFVGVASAEAERLHRIPLTPQNGFWVLCYEKERGVYIRDSPIPSPLSDVSDELTTVGVFLDCDQHTVSFYDVHKKSLIYTFTNVNLKTSLYPLISPGIRDKIRVNICVD